MSVTVSPSQLELFLAGKPAVLPVSHLDGSGGVPLMRFRHAACLNGSHLYVHGGRSGYRALRDFWKLNLGQWGLDQQMYS